MSDLNQDLVRCLLKQSEPSVFLKEAFAIFKHYRPQTNFAVLARKMNFNSRSFVRLLFQGDRHVNLKNYKQIAEGLGLGADATHFFGLIVEKHASTSKPRRGLDVEVQKSRIKLEKSLKRKIRKDFGHEMLPVEKWPLIFASLGDVETGRTLSQIARFCGESEELCAKILAIMLKNKMVNFESKTSCYKPNESILELGQLGRNRVFKNIYKEACLKSLSRVEGSFQDPKALFYCSVFSVRKSELPSLTKELQNLLTQYMVQAEDSQGDELASLTASLLPLNLSFRY